MAAMSTALTEFSTIGDSRTWVTSTHTTGKPRIVVQKRRVPQGNQTVAETTVSVIHATVDTAGAVLPQKVSFSATFRQPLDGASADVTAALAIFRDIIAGDEYGTAVTTQKFLN